MNKRMILYIIGKLLIVVALLMVLPLIASIIYHFTNGENLNLLAFVIPMALLVGLGFFLSFKKPKDNDIFAREGFVLVGLSWIIISLFGALPFVISGEIKSFFDAFFETVSGFTTTGASILNGDEIEALSHGMLFWRSFTHWIGGMGILVFVLIFIPSDGKNIFIMKAESPGPQFGKLVSKINFSARILYIIYLGLTLLQIIILVCGGMDLFDAIVNSFSTAGTGGFAIKADGIAGYNNFCQVVIAVFMMLFGINFNFFFLLLMGKFKQAFKMEEVFTYIGIVVFSTVVIAINLFIVTGNSLAIILKDSFFQVSSIITTTGFSNTDFNLWPEFSRMILIILMFVGACAGSTCGGIKVSRFIILIKSIKRNIKKMLHPKSISNISFESGILDEETISGTSNYFALMIILFAFCVLLLSLDPFNVPANMIPIEGINKFTTNFTAAASCINNIGPGLNLVGPSGSYCFYSDFSKIILSIAMLIGRLEIYPLLLLFSPKVWKNK